jgi:hypothetical protein
MESWVVGIKPEDGLLTHHGLITSFDLAVWQPYALFSLISMGVKIGIVVSI